MAGVMSDKQSSFVVNAIRQLDSAVSAHMRWVGNFNKAIICGTVADDSVTKPEGFRNCAFGKWFYSERRSEWEYWNADFQHIESLHGVMHAYARNMFEKHRRGAGINAEEYDLFMESSLRFKFALRSLTFRMIDEVCLVDQLTGVWNRSSMFKRLNEEQDRMLRSSEPCCLCMMDLDRFKEINDAYGHIAGDKVLQGVVEVTSRRLRAYDAVFRYGGEEFLFCLPNAPVDIAVEAMERVRRDVAGTTISLKGGQTVQVTASFGVAPLSPTLSVEESIEEADRALFCAKAGGRNRVCRWDVQ